MIQGRDMLQRVQRKKQRIESSEESKGMRRN